MADNYWEIQEIQKKRLPLTIFSWIAVEVIYFFLYAFMAVLWIHIHFDPLAYFCAIPQQFGILMPDVVTDYLRCFALLLGLNFRLSQWTLKIDSSVGFALYSSFLLLPIALAEGKHYHHPEWVIHPVYGFQAPIAFPLIIGLAITHFIRAGFDVRGKMLIAIIITTIGDTITFYWFVPHFIAANG